LQNTVWALSEFLASFDTDEYLTPMGNWSDLKQWLTQGVSSDTNILSFFSSKASANYDFMQPYWDGGECGLNETDAKCVTQRPDALYIETYNCGKSTILWYLGEKDLDKMGAVFSATSLSEYLLLLRCQNRAFCGFCGCSQPVQANFFLHI
jgi:hypothetical protein